MILNFKLFEQQTTLDSRLTTMDDVHGKDKPPIVHNNLYSFLIEYLTGDELHDNKIIISFIKDHNISDINDDSLASNTLIQVLENKFINLDGVNNSFVFDIYFRGDVWTNILKYIFDNYLTDPNLPIAHNLLSMTVYSHYDTLFNYLIDRPDFDPSYNNSSLLSDCIEASKPKLLLKVLQDTRVDPNKITGENIRSVICENDIEILKIIFNYKTIYSYGDIVEITNRLYMKPFDIFKLVVDNIDVTINDNNLLRKSVDEYIVMDDKPKKIKCLLSKNEVVKKLDTYLINKLTCNGYMPSYKKKKINKNI